MKTLVWSVVVAVASTWALGSVTDAAETARCKVKIVAAEGAQERTIVLDGGQGGSDVRVVVKCIQTGESPSVTTRRLVLAGDTSRGASNGTGEARVFVVAGAGDRRPISLAMAGEREGDADSGWLGVQIGSMQRDGDGGSGHPSGVVVLNVIEGSPAEDAGFEQNDVVIEVNDEAIGDDLGGLVDRIREAGAEARVKFTVLRDGERRTLIATLGSRADMNEVHWVFESAPDALLKDSLRTHVRMLLRGDDNEWHFKDLSDLGVAGDLSILRLLPKSRGKTVKVFVNDGGTTVSTTVTEDGESITIEQTGDGEIVVTRTTEGQDGETVTRYAGEDELAASDPEAHEVYKESSNYVVIDLDGDLEFPHFNFDFDFDSIDTDLDGFLEKLKDSRGAFADLKEHMADLHTNIAPRLFKLSGSRVRRTIHENADGTIEVIIRKGGNELVTHYASQEDLQARSPDDYEAYLDLLSADGDE